MKRCPKCNVPAAVHSEPHCRNKQCTWNTCQCGNIYDRGMPPEQSTK